MIENGHSTKMTRRRQGLIVRSLYILSVLALLASGTYGSFYFRNPNNVRTDRGLIPIGCLLLAVLFHWAMCFRFSQMLSKFTAEKDRAQMRAVHIVLFGGALLLPLAAGKFLLFAA